MLFYFVINKLLQCCELIQIGGMFEVFILLRWYMSAATSWRSALFLAILMAIIGPLQMTGNISVDFAESNRLSDHSSN